MSNTFQIADDNRNSESCKHCGSFDFKFRQTLSTAIVCARCDKFHKSCCPSLKATSEILDKMFEFAREKGE